MELTTSEVAAELGVTVPYVQQLLRDGKLEGRRTSEQGRPWAISADSVEAFKSSRRTAGRPRKMYEVDASGPWRLYWGAMPLPDGAEAAGTVTRLSDRAVGALLLSRLGVYYMGNAGVLASLDQDGIRQARS